MRDQLPPPEFVETPAVVIPVSVVEYHASPRMLPPTPTAEIERIESIDVLRGFAVMGILFVNIQFMANSFQSIENVHWRSLPLLDGIARWMVQIFFEMKFITLFSFLFGAGLAIMMERLERTGRPFVSVYVRRLLVLLGIGIFHGVFLWYGDILAVYALLGFAALLLRKCRPRTLFIIAALLFLLPIPATVGLAWIDPTADWSMPTWSSIASEQAQATSAATTGPASAQPAFPPAVVNFFAFLDSETRVYQSGSFLEILALRACYFVFTNLYAIPFFYIWRCLSLFLIGMAAVKLGWFATDSSRRTRWGLIAALFVTGLALEIYGDRFLGRDSRQAASVARATILAYVGSLLLSVSYGRIIVGLMNRPGIRRLFRPVACVGRMALSNYLMHSLLGGLIFYSYGLGLFGTMGSAALFGVTCAILAFQLVFSPIWLRHFQFGPVEWLWRTATYGKTQPMRRPAV